LDKESISTGRAATELLHVHGRRHGFGPMLPVERTHGMRNMEQKSGFTLLEAMIVVAIVAILAMIAIPSYRNYMCSARRADGKIALMEAAQTAERYFTNNNTYVGAAINATSEKGFYALGFSAGFPTATAFTIEAVAQGDQTADQAACLTLQITHRAQKTPAQCW
jgi:type IV pilus assembly protein PilE